MIDEGGQDGETTDAVDQHMMDHDDQRDHVAGWAGDEWADHSGRDRGSGSVTTVAARSRSICSSLALTQRTSRTCRVRSNSASSTQIARPQPGGTRTSR